MSSGRFATVVGSVCVKIRIPMIINRTPKMMFTYSSVEEYFVINGAYTGGKEPVMMNGNPRPSEVGKEKE